MNEIINSLYSRKSVRAYLNKEISQDLKDIIMESAFQAPTAGCMMFYTILEIDDPEVKKDLAVSCDNQPFIASAPFVLIFLADLQRWQDCYEYVGCEPRAPGAGDLFLAFADAFIAAQNAVTAAESLGIGSCYIGDIIENCEHIRELLNLDKYVVPAAMLVFGYPTEQQKNRPKPARFEKKYIAFKNKYRRLTKDEHAEMQTKEKVNALYKRKTGSEFSLEMQRSASEYFESFGFQR
jgi:nitroreductase